MQNYNQLMKLLIKTMRLIKKNKLLTIGIVLVNRVQKLYDLQ
jgi:hypothetical protein